MTMALGIADLSTATFKTTRGADDICDSLMSKLGWRKRYVPARLAIARSLSLADPPPPISDEDSDDMATPIRGMQLFGDGADAAAWLALITQRAGEYGLAKKTLQALVSAHWKRGAELLKEDWEHSDRDMAKFVALLAELASFAGEPGGDTTEKSDAIATTIAGEVLLTVGEIALDTRTDEKVIFPLNGAGGSPHVAIMGGVGSGKTRTAVHMLKELRRTGEVPLLVFDFKGDLADVLRSVFEAEIIHPPDSAIPLDVLHVGRDDENAVKTAAGRIRDSIASVKSRRVSGVQSEALREAISTTLRAATKGKRIDLADVAQELELEYEGRGRKPDELTALLNELTDFKLFEPNNSPSSFFAKSWIINLPQDRSAEMRRLIINLTLDALDRWLNSQPDAPRDELGMRALRHVTMLDEAHFILSTRLPALANLVRMSRSKGGVVVLVSQSPDDFEGTEDGFLDNMGMTLAFNTQAKPGPTRRIFGDGFSLAGLPVGQAVCRIRAEAKTRKIISWEP